MYYFISEELREFFEQGDHFFIRVNNKSPLYVNKEAFSILKLCNGNRHVNEIVKQIAEEFSVTNKVAASNVIPFLKQCAKNRMLNLSMNKLEEPIVINVYGSTSYWLPLHIAIELTNACSLRCKHCYANAGYGSVMENELLEKIIDDVISLKISTVQLTGGEPTLHPLFSKVLNKLVNNKINVTVTSNGYYHANELEYFNLLSGTANYVQISIDGLQQNHNEIRGKNDAYQTSIDSVEKLSNMGVNVKIATCLISQTTEEIFKLVDIVKSKGATNFTLSLLDNLGRAKENSLTTVYNRDNVMKLLNDLKKRFQSDNFTIETHDICDLEDDAYFKNCGAGYNTIKVNPEGIVSECLLSKDSMGKIDLQGGLKLYLENNLKLMKRKSNTIAPCKDVCGKCDEIDYCEFCVVRAKSIKCPKYLEV